MSFKSKWFFYISINTVWFKMFCIYVIIVFMLLLETLVKQLLSTDLNISMILSPSHTIASNEIVIKLATTLLNPKDVCLF